jgi:hypothetical protein
MSFDIPREFAADSDVSDELRQVFWLGREFINFMEAEWLWPEEAPLADHSFEKRIKDLIESKFESVDDLYRLAKQAHAMGRLHWEANPRPRPGNAGRTDHKTRSEYANVDKFYRG